MANVQVRFQVEARDPRELSAKAHAICRDVFRSGVEGEVRSHESFVLMRIGPAYPVDEMRADGALVGFIRWGADYVASTGVNMDELQKYIQTCIASRTLGV